MAIMEGKAMFVWVKETEEYQGKDTGRYAVTLVLNDETSEELANNGVRLRSYGEGDNVILQRKFVSNYPVRVIDAEGNALEDFPDGSKVRISYKYGNEHPIHGVPVYMDGIRVLEMGGVGGDPAL